MASRTPPATISGAAFESGLRSMQTTHKTILMLRSKIVVVGDACVGKTALMQMLKSGGHDYPKNYIMVRPTRLPCTVLKYFVVYVTECPVLCTNGRV